MRARVQNVSIKTFKIFLIGSGQSNLRIPVWTFHSCWSPEKKTGSATTSVLSSALCAGFLMFWGQTLKQFWKFSFDMLILCEAPSSQKLTVIPFLFFLQRTFELPCVWNVLYLLYLALFYKFVLCSNVCHKIGIKLVLLMNEWCVFIVWHIF